MALGMQQTCIIIYMFEAKYLKLSMISLQLQNAENTVT
jgi:hypothetical protein